MGKSLGNFITLEEMFDGSHDRLEQAYTPMTVRFFILQAHYRSTLDFSNEALQAAEKGFNRLMAAVDTLEKIKPVSESTIKVSELETKFYEAMNDDLNTPILIAHLFDGVKQINSVADGKAQLSAEDLEKLKKLYHMFVYDVLGLEKAETSEQSEGNNALDDVMKLVLELRANAKTNKDWGTADAIRDQLKAAGIVVKDTKDGATWAVE